MRFILSIAILIACSPFVFGASDIVSDSASWMDAEISTLDASVAPPTSQAVAHYATAVIMHLRDRKLSDESIVHLKKALSSDPESAFLLGKYVEISRLAKKSGDEVTEDLITIGHENPQALILNLVVASRLFKKEQPTEAIELTENCLGYYDTRTSEANLPELVRMIALLGRHFREEKDVKKGNRLFSHWLGKPALAENLDLNQQACYFYAMAVENSVDEPSDWWNPGSWFADGEKTTLQKKLKHCIATVEQNFSENYIEPLKLLSLIHMLRTCGMSDRAESAILNNLLSKPDDLVSMKSLAEFYAQTDQFGKAQLVWKAIIRDFKPDEDDYINLARTAFRAGRFSAARDTLLDFLKNHCKDAKVRDRAISLLAWTYLNLDDPEKALEQTSKLQYWPSQVYLSALCYRRLEKYDEALQAMRRAEEMAKQSEQNDLLDTSFYITFAFMADKAKELQAAEKCLLKLLKKEPEDPELNNFLGYLWADHNVNLDKAEKMIRIAVKADPQNAAYLDSLAWVLYRQGKFPEALVEIEKALMGSDQLPDAVIADHAGDIYIAVGKDDLAMKYWKLALETHSEDLDRSKVEDKIRRFSR